VSSYGGHFAQAARNSIVLRYLSPRSQIIVTTVPAFRVLAVTINPNLANFHSYLIKMLIVLLISQKDYELNIESTL